MTKPLVAIANIEKNLKGHCRPAMLRRATFRALAVADRKDDILFDAMRHAGVCKIPATNSESLFANAHKNRDWADAIARLLGTSVYTLYPNTFPKQARATKTARLSLRTRPTMLSSAALEMLEQKIRDRGGLAAVAKASGLSRKTVENMMRSFGSPHFLTVASVCSTLGVSLDTFAASCGIARGGKS